MPSVTTLSVTQQPKFDFTVSFNGAWYTLTPNNLDATHELSMLCPEGAWTWDALIVEMRFLYDILEDLLRMGYTAEQDGHRFYIGTDHELHRDEQRTEATA